MQQSKIFLSKGLILDRNMLTQSQFSQIKFYADLENIKLFYNVLKSIHFHEDVYFEVTEEGCRIVTEDSKCVQANVFISKEYFREFRVNPVSVSFKVNLNVIMDCFSIFSGVECSMKMIYKGDGAPLIFILEQHGEEDLLTECSIKTKTTQDVLDFTMEDDDIENNIIFRSPDFLSFLLNEFDKSAEEIEIFISPNLPHFRMTSLSLVQIGCNVEVSKNSDMICSFSCKTETNFKYKASHIRTVMKSLSLGAKVSLRTDDSGLLGMQVMVLIDEDAKIYIDYFITPLLE